MKVLVDSREQAPLEFDHPYITEVVVTKLNVGDYGVMFENGHCPSVFFERKGLSDLFGTMGNGYKRFKREIIRAQTSESTLIIIVEGSLTKILSGTKYSSISGLSILRKMFTLWVRYGVLFVCCKDRAEMSKYITEFYYSLGMEYLRKQRESKRATKSN